MKPNNAVLYRQVPLFVKQLRLSAKLTQVELGKLLGKPQPWIARIESGTRRVDVAEFALIAKTCGCDPVIAFRQLKNALPI